MRPHDRSHTGTRHQSLCDGIEFSVHSAHQLDANAESWIVFPLQSRLKCDLTSPRGSESAPGPDGQPPNRHHGQSLPRHDGTVQANQHAASVDELATYLNTATARSCSEPSAVTVRERRGS
ncbi:hypothetical protein BN159_1665 [Streptomyces davaonensis JCM 4913]|uniref:Uncharacterized protein n=1 Tax=Streptomyces davaonensis (strain DSM 101723 / JCM 4913 / KCC S-0913 / 768) TaxID=1214101 RepID=K4R080_STRDJ|nr:hypothetical protein BN159_1665 [Streptomyces davaonensis JCM 4913]